ncbi:MAG: hypothetical protein RR359_01355 [Bacilli bacterium]
MELIILLLIAGFIMFYRVNKGESVYKYIVKSVGDVYDKYAPYSFKTVREKAKELGLEFTTKQYTIQVLLFGGGAFLISYLYFYSIVTSIIYVIAVIAIIPYLAYLRCKRIYSEFVFEQIQVYTTNTIMEFATTQSFVKSLEGVYKSGVLQDPVLSDVKMMIDMAYEKGDIEESISYMNNKYEFYMTKNMHQLFYQITKEGALDTHEILDNMLLDIDMLVEGVYRDRMDRQNFHKSFVQYGFMLYLMIGLVQLLLGVPTYVQLLNNIFVKVLLHVLVIMNSYFLLSGEKYYNENVGAE